MRYLISDLQTLENEICEKHARYRACSIGILSFIHSFHSEQVFPLRVKSINVIIYLSIKCFTNNVLCCSELPPKNLCWLFGSSSAFVFWQTSWNRNYWSSHGLVLNLIHFYTSKVTAVTWDNPTLWRIAIDFASKEEPGGRLSKLTIKIRGLQQKNEYLLNKTESKVSLNECVKSFWNWLATWDRKRERSRRKRVLC